MNNHPRITAIVGTYRKGGIIDQAVDEILAAATAAGAEATKIYLLDKHIEFCTNCRSCTQAQGSGRGQCMLVDDISAILDQIERSDALVLASPMNFWTVTAIMNRFIERLVCYAYWPWGKYAPKVRNKQKTKRAVVVASSASPAIIARLFTKIISLLKGASALLDAKTIGVLLIGLASVEQQQKLGERTKKKARRLGKKLVAQ